MTTMTDVIAFLPDQLTSSSSTTVDCSPAQNATTSAGDPCGATTQSSDVESRIGDVAAAVIAVLLSAVIIGTLLGNASVILAVIVYEKMRTLSNVLIASLASADLLVAIVVMPISLQVGGRIYLQSNDGLW